MRGRRGPVQPSFHPRRNKDQQRAMNWIRPLILRVLSIVDEGTMELVVDVVLLISESFSSVAPVIVKVGVTVVSMSIIDLEIA